MDILSTKRKMAKSAKWQMLYHNSKELGIRLFKNNDNFSGLQLSFLQDLAFYSSIYTDISLGEVSQKVLDSTIYEDAYMYYKVNKKYKTKLNDDTKSTKTKWHFKTPK